MAHPGQTGPNAGKPGINDDEAPLDPAVERVRRKLVRLLLWSFGIMILGLIAVFSTIVYKIYAPAPREEKAVEMRLPVPSAALPKTLPGGLLEADIGLPAGSQIVATSIDGPHLLIHLDVAEPATPGQLIIVDIASGKIVRRFSLTGGEGR